MMRAMLLTSVLALSACVSILPEAPPAPTLFVLEADAVTQAQGAVIDRVISVARPSGERTLLGSDLVWRTGDQVAFVAGARWTGDADALLQTVLVQTLAQQQRFRAAVRAGDAIADYQVRWTVQNFEAVESGMTARFVADVTLVASGRQVVATERVVAEAPVAERSPQAAAQALTRAAREGGARIALFAADAAAAAEARRAAAEN
ncbi:MAG: ABC-type transport auxiliary lipoprotein family protein [Hyphomonadaceae bacterium]|nr:ABC-type transport auxiliary lipoprotein family protein [Hyphomonadaceae bacterium]